MLRLSARNCGPPLDSNKPDSSVGFMVKQLGECIKEWKVLAQTIQQYYYANREHVTDLVRELALDLWSYHAKFDFSRQLMTMLQEVFAEDGEIANLIAQDMDAWETSENAPPKCKDSGREIAGRP